MITPIGRPSGEGTSLSCPRYVPLLLDDIFLSNPKFPEDVHESERGKDTEHRRFGLF